MIIGLGLIVGCQADVYYSQSLDLGEGAIWDEAMSLNSNFSIADTSSTYDLFLDIDHSSDYQYENVYLEVTTTFPHKESVSQVLSIDLADKRGQWQGKCRGDQCNLRVVLKEATRFDKAGDYGLSISQHSRESALSGISNVEFLLVASE